MTDPMQNEYDPIEPQSLASYTPRAQAVDDFESPEERAECDECLAGFEGEFGQSTSAWNELPLADKQSLFRGIRKESRNLRRHGVRNRHTAHSHLRHVLSNDPRYSSILTIIGMSILSQLIEWALKRLWERWFGPKDERGGFGAAPLVLLLAMLCGSAHATPPTFDDVSALDGAFIFNESISDNPASPHVPSPVTWNSELSAFDFSPFTVCVTTGVTIPGSVPRSALSGGTLIAPSWLYCNRHVPGTGEDYVLMKGDGTEIQRSRVQYIPLTTAAHPDAGLIRLDEPVTEIEPAAILTDISCLAGEDIACIQMDRHISVMTVADSIGGTALNKNAIFIYVWQPTSDNDELGGGDSGKAAFAFIDGHAVLVTGFAQAGVNEPYAWGSGWNPSSDQNLSVVAGYVQASGESLTLIDSAQDDEHPDPPTPGRYHVRTVGDSAVTVGGIPLTFDIEE